MKVIIDGVEYAPVDNSDNYGHDVLLLFKTFEKLIWDKIKDKVEQEVCEQMLEYEKEHNLG